MESNIDLNQLQKEVLVSTDVSGQYWNVCVWDYLSGTNLQTYKNSPTIPQGLVFLRQDYMINAIYNKPYLSYWNLKGKTQQGKINTAACVTCLAASNCGNFMALGIEDKVFVLETHSGRIVSIITRHLQDISALKFAYNDHYLITASNDSTIIVWDFNELLTSEKESLKPKHVWNSHTMGVNDLFVSLTSDRVVSVSDDQTCKFWSINSESKSPSTTITFQSVAVRCILDHLESTLYVGLMNGVILGLEIKSILGETNKMLTETMDLNKSFIGHSKKINCIDISLDDFTLASGSDDGLIKVWDTQSRQCLKTINQNGQVTNLFFKARTLFLNDEPNLVPTLSSRYVSEGVASGSDSRVSVKSERSEFRSLGMDDFLSNTASKSSLEDCQDEYFDLKYKYENMKNMKNKVYSFTIDKIINSN